VRAGAPDLLAEKPGDDRADKRCDRHSEEERRRKRRGHGQGVVVSPRGDTRS
jgi:hypothetical protein